MSARADANGQQHVGFDAYGRHFDITLEPNTNISRAVSAHRSDIKPYRGTVTGRAGSWVRLTQTRDGWRGIVSDGHELYAIETPADVSQATAQPLNDGDASADPVVYRLADAVVPDDAAYCGTDGGENLTSTSASAAADDSKRTALSTFAHIAEDLSQKDTTSATTRQLVVAVVADHTFTDAIGADPEGAIVSRMDIVDGIWSSQVGINIVLAPVTILTDGNDSFSSTTSSNDLLSELSAYRGGLPAKSQYGLTHLMTGRSMDGNIIGIAYLSEICNGADSVSLSQSTGSTTMGALIAAHEIGHNFNAVHDGVAGSCATTPQTYLMAPTINYSNQFSSCSLQAINARLKSASCVTTVAAASSSASTSADSSSTSSTAGSSVVDGSSPTSSTSSNSGGSGSLDLTYLLALGGSLLTARRRAAR